MKNKPKRKYSRGRASQRTGSLSIQDELDILSGIYGRILILGIAPELRACGAGASIKKYQSLVKSLDGAIRHRQGLRDRDRGGEDDKS